MTPAFLQRITDRLQANKTLNFTAAMSAATIQAMIDAVPKNLNGYSLTLQFADGTYNLGSSRISVALFFGGYILIGGNATNNTASLTKSVILTKTGTSQCLYIDSTLCYVEIRYIDFVNTDSTGELVKFNRCYSGYVRYCAFHSFNTTSASTWITFDSQFSYILDCVGYKGYWGIRCTIGTVTSYTNSSDSSNKPTYGLRADSGGRIAKGDATQPAGGTAAESTASGGSIV